MTENSKIQDLILKRTESQLPEGLPNDQVRAILERPDAEGFVQSLDPQVLFRLIRAAEWEESRELVPLASPWQVQVFIDLDSWNKDRFTVTKLIPWMESVVVLASDQQFKRICRDTDPEILAMLFKSGLIVGLPDEHRDPPPEMAHLDYETSPDGVYFIAYPKDEEKGSLLRKLVVRLYAIDRVLAWTLLEAARWEMMSGMEEEAYRWRNSRLEEFGFVSRDEALEIYAFLDPVRLRERVDAGKVDGKHFDRVARANFAMISPPTDDDFFLFQAISGLEDEEMDRVMNEFVVVQNRTMLADGVEPGQLDSVKDVGERSAGYASIGLEFLSRGDLEKASELLKVIPLKDVFRAGFSLTARLSKTANDLKRRPTLTLVEGQPFTLAGPRGSRRLTGLTRSRPVCLDKDNEFVWFSQQRQIDETAAQLAFIAFKQLWLFGVAAISEAELADLTYGGSILNEPPEVTFDAIFTTFIAQTLVGVTEPKFRALSSQELGKIPRLLRGKPWNDDPVLFFEPNLGPIIESVPAGSLGFATRWIQESIERLGDELDRVTETPEPGLLTGFLIVETDS